jgi:hypothetical protein
MSLGESPSPIGLIVREFVKWGLVCPVTQGCVIQRSDQKPANVGCRLKKKIKLCFRCAPLEKQSVPDLGAYRELRGVFV